MSCQVEADLPAGLSCLKNVDALLHCPICFDFFNISMMTKCSHNFCSLCIRKFLSYKPHCPVCNAHATETDLRNNRILDELVVNFQAARQQLSKQNFESPPISPTTTASEVKYKTPRKRAQKSNGAVLSHFFQKKSKTSPTVETHRDGSISQWVQRGKIQTTLSYCANDGDLHLASPHRPAAVKEEPMDVEVASVHRLMSVKQEDSVSHSVTARDDVAHSSSPSQDVKPTIKVECPVCSVSVSKQFINKHLDTCLTSGEKKESLRSSLTRTRHPMNKLVYNLLSVHELKRRLKECHLSTQGSRDQMIKRHQEFVHIYNSQCDSLNPKSAEDIAKEVEANERMKNQLQGKAKPVMVFTKNHTEKEIDEMHSNYRKQHSSDFSRLIAQVRGRLETTRQTRIKEEAGVTVERDNVKIPSADLVAESKKTESEEDDEEPLVRGIVLSPSPSYSDVSISRFLPP
ncbi:E3 ubiquitin-protein ligase RAD18 isoform X2 [Echeneis naucrates]|uniref:E3 ubiquitin-protein ligase RAD18 isoform X2 n=1 Tax=Echeneis naucrates TaxID=173247 RepID=UPI001113D1A5|nr:E3 ubiquitin-protein ligase RAD18 isoform X2 [Echeneis naucrates]